AHDQVVGGVERQLLRRAAFGGDYKNVIVAVAVGREGNPLAVGRKARIDVARFVDGQTLQVTAVLVCDPDVAQIAERYFAVVIIGMPQQLDLSRGQRRPKQ